MSKKLVFLITSILNFILFILSALYGFAAFELGRMFRELDVQLPLYSRLWMNFWWIPSVIFLSLTVILFIKYKKMK